MDYTQAPLVFRIRKALRYVRLYGLPLTAAKVRAIYHMRKKFDPLPLISDKNGSQEKHVAIVGCGRFAFGSVAYYLRRKNGNVIRCAMDVDINRAASLFRAYEALYYTDQVDEILQDECVDLVFVTSNHASHAEYAIEALKRGKSVHIEKPHVVTHDQLTRLLEAMDQNPSASVRLGFNRPHGRLGQSIINAVSNEAGPMMINWFIAGHALEEGHWYYAPTEGGRVLGNLTHWIDFTYRLVDRSDRWPITIQVTRADEAINDFVVSYAFGKGSLATISFSAKGHTFEGVMERLAVHRGNLLLTMDDFQTLTMQRADTKKRTRLRHRDHGHRSATQLSYGLSGPERLDVAHDSQYVFEIGSLTLKTREAVEQGQTIVLPAPDSRADLSAKRL